MRPRWPLHPPPREFDVLEHWIERLAAAYGVSKLTFCRQALGLTPPEIAMLRDNPPEQALANWKLEQVCRYNNCKICRYIRCFGG